MKRISIILFMVLTCILGNLVIYGLWTRTANAETVIAEGVFDLELLSGQKLAFQHSTFTVVVTVVSGILNTTQNALTMYSGSGVLGFRALDSCTILASCTNPDITVTHPGAISPNNWYEIRWAITSAQGFNFPLMLGLFGLVGMFASPLYMIHLFREGEYFKVLEVGFVIFLISLALFVGWLNT